MDNHTARPSTELTVPGKAIWIHADGQSKPHMHIVDGDCDCQTCESKIRRIIFPYAA